MGASHPLAADVSGLCPPGPHSPDWIHRRVIFFWAQSYLSTILLLFVLHIQWVYRPLVQPETEPEEQGEGTVLASAVAPINQPPQNWTGRCLHASRKPWTAIPVSEELAPFGLSGTAASGHKCLVTATLIVTLPSSSYLIFRIMPQSQEFWRYARQMREYESETPEDQRVYLCILRLAGKLGRDSGSDSAIATITSQLGQDLDSLEHVSSDAVRSMSTTSLDIDPQRQPARSNTSSALLRKVPGFSMPKIVKKWHEIGTLRRHWAMEVRGSVYELHRDEEKNKSKFRRKPVAQVEHMQKRLTARLYVGRTHMTDAVILAIASGLINLQSDYDFQMDNCQHFAAVLIPRILCANHCHMTVLPSASLPYLKHSEFGNFQAGVKSGKLSEVYHRYLHQTRNLVWQQSAYYFAIREDFQPNCDREIVTNPYLAATRLTRGNFSRPQAKDCSRRSEEQRGVLWKSNGTFENLNDDAQKRMFPKAVHPPEGRTFGVWAMHHIREGTEALLWTPQMVNEWLEANEASVSLKIDFPQHYFNKLKAQISAVSLDLPAAGNALIPNQLEAGPWYKPQVSRLLPTLWGNPRPRLASTHSIASYDSRSDSIWSAGSSDSLSTYESSLMSTCDNVEYDVPDVAAQCMCTECIELYDGLAKALELSERDEVLFDEQQMLDDENMARAIAMSEDERADSMSRAAESEDQVYAALLQSRDEESALQQMRDDEALARQMSQDDGPGMTAGPSLVVVPPLRNSDSEASIDSLYSSSIPGRRGSYAHSPLRSAVVSAFDMAPIDHPPSYEESLEQLPSYTVAPA